MGVGKSTHAAAVAARLGHESVDLDALIEQRAGCPISELFAQRGERAFRDLEREVVLELLERDDITVALGGGTVLDPEVRRRLLRAGTLITLSADLDTLMARVGQGLGRPLLEGDPRTKLAALLERRRAVYSECHAELPTSAADLPAEIERVHRAGSVVVPLGLRTYRVEIGTGIRSALPRCVAGYERVIVVADDNSARWVPDALSRSLVLLPEGETHKRVSSVELIWDEALARGVGRNACLVAVGGGVVGDLTGFAAATLLRGVAFGQVPTTLLAMVDSSVGGKTGFNRDAGKNLVGAFHQPAFVLCDVEVLSSLPQRDRTAGLGEVVKSAWLAGEGAVELLERDAAALEAGESDALLRAIRMSVALKSDVVADDEREAGRRRILNLGHTVGHALEAVHDYQLRHGEAVALGLVAATRVARRHGGLGEAPADRLVKLLQRLGLPTDLDSHLRPGMVEYVARDKKRAADGVLFVLPGEPGHVEVRHLAPEAIIAALQ